MFLQWGWCKEQFIVKNIILKQEHIQYDQMTPEIFSQNAQGREERAYNCEPQDAFKDSNGQDKKKLPSMQITSTRQYQKQQTYTVTQQYSVTTTAAMNLSGGALTLGLLSFGGSISVQGNETTVHATADTNTQMWSGGVTYNGEIAPLSMVKARITDYPTKFTIPFTVEATVDADIWAGDHHPRSQLLSKIITSPEQRLVTFKGEIVVNDFSVAQILPEPIQFSSVADCLDGAKRALNVQ
jgi:hypothetical protein